MRVLSLSTVAPKLLFGSESILGWTEGHTSRKYYLRGNWPPASMEKQHNASSLRDDKWDNGMEDITHGKISELKMSEHWQHHDSLEFCRETRRVSRANICQNIEYASVRSICLSLKLILIREKLYERGPQTQSNTLRSEPGESGILCLALLQLLDKSIGFRERDGGLISKSQAQWARKEGEFHFPVCTDTFTSISARKGMSPLEMKNCKNVPSSTARAAFATLTGVLTVVKLPFPCENGGTFFTATGNEMFWNDTSMLIPW